MSTRRITDGEHDREARAPESSPAAVGVATSERTPLTPLPPDDDEEEVIVELRLPVRREGGPDRSDEGLSPAPPKHDGEGRGSRAGLFTGVVAGPLLFVSVYLAELVAGTRLSMMGVHDEELQRTLFGRFGTWLVRQQLEVLAAYVAVGLGLGLVAAVSLALRDALSGRSPSKLRRFVGVAGLVALGYVWRLAVSVVQYPQLYADALYAKGGARRALQLYLTDHVPLALLVAAGWAFLAFVVCGPLLLQSGRREALAAVKRARQGLVDRRRELALAGLVGAVACVAVAVLLQRSRLASASSAPSKMAAPGALAKGTGPDEPGLTDGSAPTPPTTTSAEGRPNVLLLAVDSLRADRVGPGHEAVAPHLAELAARGVHFQSAYVSIPRTFPSWTTLLSGRFAPHHGLRHMFPPASTRAKVGMLLPARFLAAGFHTAVVSDFAGEIFSRLGAGFQEQRVPYFDMKVVLAQAGWNVHPLLFPFVANRYGHRVFPALAAAAENADPDRLADDVIATIDRSRAAGSFFVTAFFSATHFPYAAPDPYYRRFTRRDYAGPFRYHKPVAAFSRTDGSLADEDVAQIRALYDGSVAAVDDAIGRVLAALRERGLDRNTIVVVLADHGENLFDPGRGMGHGEHLRGDAALHIPLVIYDPVHRFPAHATRAIVRDVDLAPTLAALAGLPMDDVDGADLGPLLRGERDTLDLVAYAESELWLVPEGPGFGPTERLPYPALPALVTVAPDDDIVIDPALESLTTVARHRAVRTDRWKLLYMPTREGPRLELYDVQRDPDERIDVAAQHPEVVASLRVKLDEYLTMDGSVIESGYAVPPR